MIAKVKPCLFFGSFEKAIYGFLSSIGASLYWLPVRQRVGVEGRRLSWFIKEEVCENKPVVFHYNLKEMNAKVSLLAVVCLCIILFIYLLEVATPLQPV